MSVAVRFLREPVPPGGTKQWREWKTRAQDLLNEDPGATSALFIETLENGTVAEQYAALLGLRLVLALPRRDGGGALWQAPRYACC